MTPHLRLGILPIAVVSVVALAAAPRQTPARPPAEILRALNQIVGTHAYGRPGPQLELAAEGAIVRKDGDGSVFRFRLLDIGDMSIDRDAEAHVLLPCKSGARCVARHASASAPADQMGMLVFSIYPADRGDDVLRLFRELQAALAAPAPTKR